MAAPAVGSGHSATERKRSARRRRRRQWRWRCRAIRSASGRGVESGPRQPTPRSRNRPPKASPRRRRSPAQRRRRHFAVRGLARDDHQRAGAGYRLGAERIFPVPVRRYPPCRRRRSQCDDDLLIGDRRGVGTAPAYRTSKASPGRGGRAARDQPSPSMASRSRQYLPGDTTSGSVGCSAGSLPAPPRSGRAGPSCREHASVPSSSA
jgi:hypothetical protein